MLQVVHCHSQHFDGPSILKALLSSILRCYKILLIIKSLFRFSSKAFLNMTGDRVNPCVDEKSVISQYMEKVWKANT